MTISGQAVLLRVFIGESDKLGHLPLYEVIFKRARGRRERGGVIGRLDLPASPAGDR